MTSEQEQYGGGWGVCVRCGVKDRADQLTETLEHGRKVVVHKDERFSKCLEWKEERAGNPRRNGVH